eukprot:2794565-Rhodomonas_salina.1
MGVEDAEELCQGPGVGNAGRLVAGPRTRTSPPSSPSFLSLNSPLSHPPPAHRQPHHGSLLPILVTVPSLRSSSTG